jgi:hypothetical protein
VYFNVVLRGGEIEHEETLNCLGRLLGRARTFNVQSQRHRSKAFAQLSAPIQHCSKTPETGCSDFSRR